MELMIKNVLFRSMRSMNPCCKFCAHRSASTSSSDSSSWIFIEGFSPQTSRKDLEMVLDDLVPLTIDPVLNADTAIPTGGYAIQLSSLGDKYHEWMKRVSSDYKLRRVEKRVLDKSLLAFRDQSISNCTVRLRNFDRRFFSEEKVYSFFEDYDLKKGIIPSQENHRKKDPVVRFGHNKKERAQGNDQVYLIHFESPEEAQRAVAEKSSHDIDGSQIKLFWYQC